MISRQPPAAPLRAGMLSGGVAAIAASLLSLPLESPHDGVANTASVAILVLIAGVVAGVIWRLIPADSHRTGRFFLAIVLGLSFVVAATVLAQTQLERSVSFWLPIAALSAVIIGGGVPLLADKGRALPWWLALAAVFVALAIGVALAGQGDQESGELELPPRTADFQRSSSVTLLG